MSSNDRYMYTVKPRGRISGLSDGQFVRVAKTLSLNKDDVQICLRRGIVYRVFPDGSERVFPMNLDRLHNAKHYTEEEWNQVKVKELSKDQGSVIAPVVESPKVVVEEKKPEPVVVEEKVEKVEKEVQTTVEPVAETTEEDASTVSVDASDEKSEDSTDTSTEVAKESVENAESANNSIPENRQDYNNNRSGNVYIGKKNKHH